MNKSTTEGEFQWDTFNCLALEMSALPKKVLNWMLYEEQTYDAGERKINMKIG